MSRTIFITILAFAALISPIYGDADFPEDIPPNQTSEIMIKIQEEQPVDYDHAIIKGNIYVTEEKLLNNCINSPIKIKDSKIYGIIIFENIDFNDKVDFEGTEFHGIVIFKNNTFNKDVRFFKTIFWNSTVFSNSIFAGYADFENIQMIEEAFFDNTKFNTSFFSKSKIKNYTAFFNAQFLGFADFSGTRFSGITDFHSTKFKNNADFNECLFAEYANFWNATFNESARFSFAKFERVADFRGTQFNNKVDFRYIYFSDILIYWDSIKRNLFCGNSTYLALINYFKENGHYKDARNCYYEYRDRERIGLPLGWSTPIEYLSWISCGYGVRPSFTILWINFFIILFASIYWRSTLNSYKAMKRKNITIQIKRFINSLYFSFLVFFHINRSSYPKRFKVPIWLLSLEEAIGWFLLGLLLIVLFNVMSTW